MRKTLTGEKNSRYTRKAVPCTVCGKDVLATPYRIEHTQNIFCSRECYREYFHNYVEGEKMRIGKVVIQGIEQILKG